MAFAENLSVFFSEKDFSVEAIVALTGNSPRKIQVIFDNQIQSVDLLDSTIAANAPGFTCKSTDLAGVKRGNAVSIGNANYAIERIEADGTGVSTVYLRT